MNDILEKLMQKNNIHSLKNPNATNAELEEALLEIAENQANLEDALVELAEMIGGELNG